MAAAAASLLLVGCATLPGERFDALLKHHALEAETVLGTRFRHLYVRKPGRRDLPGLRVYLDGDGSPWVRGRWVARDPTPREPVALRLMLRDPGAALYLGRPCYHRVDDQPPCHPGLWTNGRYSEAVVDSMAVALRRLLGSEGGLGAVTLVGYSGGGALGMLLARRLDRVGRLVTVAANLDTDAWTRLHGYSPLNASLNPAIEPPLQHSVMQAHLAGQDDQTVPPWLIERALAKELHADLAVVAGFDHHCCWDSIWPVVLDVMRQSDDLCTALQQGLPAARCRRVTTQPY